MISEQGQTWTYLSPGPLPSHMGYEERSIGEFLAEIASTRVVPAGGSAAAVVGAVGTALCEMACIHTVEHGDDADGPSEVAAVREDLASQRAALLTLADRDAEVVEELLSTDPPTGAAKRAAGVPLAVAEACLTVLDHAVVVTERGNPSVVPDAVSGAFFLRAALQASVFTVRTNLERLDDSAVAESMERRAAEVEASAGTAFERIREITNDL